MNPKWTDERVALLRKRWAEGRSATQIAKELGGFAHTRDGGRNAVIGKVHRLGLAGHGRANTSRAQARQSLRQSSRKRQRPSDPRARVHPGVGNVDREFDR